ncbi:hypothetical protein C0991_000596, partial [Blastosporella zonata]
VTDLDSPSPPVAKRARGCGSVNKNPLFQKSMADLVGSHPTTRILVDEGLEGTIGVRLNWTTWAVVKLAPYPERLAYQATQGPDKDGSLARKPAPLKGRFRPKLPFPVALALEEVEGAPKDRWTGLAGRLMQAQAEVAKIGYLHQLAQLELQELVEELDVGEADAEGKEETQEDWEAKMARREGEEEERGAEAEAKRAESKGDAGREEADQEAKRAKREEEAGGKEEAKMAKREEREEERDQEAERDTGLSEAFFPLPQGVRPGLGKMA